MNIEQHKASGPTKRFRHTKDAISEIRYTYVMFSLKTPAPGQQNWTYVSLAVIDGQRILKPAQVGYDCVLFREPPRLESKQIEIILRRGDAEQRSFATVLPHDRDATRIPIQLVPAI